MSPTPEPNSFLQFWIIVGFVAFILLQLVTLVITLSGRKQKREVSFSETPASKKEFDQFTATTNANFVSVRAEMAADRHANQVHASERSKTLFNQMEKTRTDLDTKMDTTRTELDSKIDEVRRELSEKIDNMESRIIATLKNTGAI